ncbi:MULTISPECIES: HAD domain-containing protein [Cupriavidus]
MSERLIMLDVPGVLYSGRSEARLGGIPDTGTLRDVRFFDPLALGFVRRLFGLAGARVVVSEAWRRGVPAAILQQLDLQVEGMTPDVPGGHAARVAAYFAKRPAPQAFAILTCDTASLRDEQYACLRPHTVAVNPAEGLTPANFKQALDVLGVACPSTLSLDTQPDAGLEARLQRLRRLAREAPARFAPGAIATPLLQGVPELVLPAQVVAPAVAHA